MQTSHSPTLQWGAMAQVLGNSEIRLSVDAELTTELFISLLYLWPQYWVSLHYFSFTLFLYITLSLATLLGAGKFEVVVKMTADLVL